MKIYLDNCCFNRPFDYTKWSQDMFEGLSVRELSEIAKKELAEKELNS